MTENSKKTPLYNDNEHVEALQQRGSELNSITKGDIIIYHTADDNIKIDVRLEDENVWLSQQQIAELYQSSRTNIVEHIKHIYQEGELTEGATGRKFRQVQLEGTRSVGREIPFYNLDMIILLGYRIKSLIATKFRVWASERLKEYMIKGFTMDDDRLKQIGGGGYWYELLNRIRDIRSSEKVLYRQVLDLYATSTDYNPKSDESVKFFKIVQNKLHFAAHGHTASEIVFERADSNKPFMGLTAFPGEQPTKSDVMIAKNYLDERELKVLNNLVSGYFDFAEIQAMNRNPMYMRDYIEHLDRILAATGSQLLNGAGSISHRQATEKAEREYRKYQQSTLSSVESVYLESIKSIEKKVKRAKKTRNDE